MAGTFALHQPVLGDWERVRELRLRMVLDTPIAFLETPEQVRAITEEEWRSRIARSLSERNTRVVAVSSDGTWVGTMSCFISDGEPGYLTDPRPGPPRANLVGVFVDAAWRGDAGVADALLDAIIAWVHEQRIAELFLHVGDVNARARRYYEKRGFRPTGVVAEIPEQPGTGEIEMVLRLSG
jgi:GNAT superfamily N-acetyltransferase